MFAGAEERCPGEPSCQRFESAAGQTREEKLHACTACPLLPTKPAQIGEDAAEIITRNERLARERDSGRAIFDELSTLEMKPI